MLSSCGRIDKDENAQGINNKTVVWTFLGAPGSGKGTIAEQCVKDLGFATVSTGAMLRACIARGDELGKQVDSLVKEGKLVPDEPVTEMVKRWLADNVGKYKSLIVDGFPRNEKQTVLFLDMLKKQFPQVTLRVVRIMLPDQAIVKRLADRLVCSNKSCQAIFSKSLLKDGKEVCDKCGSALVRRADDNEDVVRARLQEYAKNEKAIVDTYTAAGVKIEDVNADGKTMDQVFQDFRKVTGA